MCLAEIPDFVIIRGIKTWQWVLAVDDAAFVRMMLNDILTENRYEVAGEAANGNDARDKDKELKPALVTPELLKQLKRF